MSDFLLVLDAMKWHIVGLFSVGWIVTRAVRSDLPSGYPVPQERPLSVAPSPTHGPWSDHASGCRCLVCK